MFEADWVGLRDASEGFSIGLLRHSLSQWLPCGMWVQCYLALFFHKSRCLNDIHSDVKIIDFKSDFS